MRTHIAILAASLLLLSACAGVAARNKALLPAMASAYVSGKWENKGIYWDIREGIKAKERTKAAAQELRLLADDMGDALKSSDYRRVMRIDWPRLAILAELGISARILDGQIGEGVALSYRERVSLFSRSFQLLGAG